MKITLRKMFLTYAKIFSLGFALQLIGVNVLLAQQVNVTGKVTSPEDPEGLPGVTILEKGTTNGVVTNLNGAYSISVSEGATLLFSSVGYITQERVVGNESVIDMALSADVTQLQEIVVVGYGTQERRDLTGSVASISSEDISKTPVADAAMAIQGRLPGVSVTSQDGRPGADMRIRVRGGGSISQSNQPLIIVDGFPATSLNTIAPSQIESIDVLKDASATAIYGARGANGVIMVTTKSGKVGRPVVSYDGFAQWNTVPKYLDVMDGYDYIAYNWAYAAAIGDQYADAWERMWAIGRHEGSNTAGIDHYRNVPSEDFSRQLYTESFTQSHNLSVSTGTENTKFLIAMNYIDDEGMKAASGFNRANFQIKLDQNLGKNLSFTLNSRFAQINSTDNEGNSEAYYFRPIATSDVLGDMDVTSNTQLGDYNRILQDEFNPVSILNDQVRDNTRNELVNNIGLNWDIVNGLSFSTNFSHTTYWSKSENWDGAVASNYLLGGEKTFSGDAEINTSDGWYYRWNNTLDYHFQGLGTDHKLNILAGMELANSYGERSTMWGDKYPVTYDSDRAFANMQDYLVEELAPGSTNLPPVHGGLSTEVIVPYRMMSYFGRVNYAYKDRYLLTGTFRADGSSKFAPDNRWGYFPAGSFGWRLSKESFMSGTSSWLDDLKLRVAYGTVGSDQIESNLWKQTWASKITQFSINEARQPSYIPANESIIANPNLIWETTITRDIGLDFTIFNGKLSGTIDYYHNSVKDLLVTTAVTPLTGFPDTQDNVGSTSNKGVEFSFNYDVVSSEDFNLRAGFNINFNRNNVDELDEGVTGFYSSGNGGVRQAPSTGDYFLTVGKPVGLYRGWIHDGVYTLDDFTYDEDAQIYTLKPGVPDLSSGLLPNIYGTFENKPGSQTAYPGVQKVKDLNGDGIIDDLDITIIGDANPTHTGGFDFSGNWKNIDFGMQFIWSVGNEIFNANHARAFLGNKEAGLYRNRFQELASAHKIYDIVDGQLVNVVEPAALAALNANSTVHLPYPESAMNTTYNIEDGSFLRLNTVTIGYSLPESMLSKAKISRFRIYGTIYNAFTITNYTGMDPEVNVMEDANGTYPTPGLDYNFYPRARRFTLGVNVQF